MTPNHEYIFMTRKHLLYGNLLGTALFVMGAVPAFAESLPNHSAREKALYSEAILKDGNLDKVTGRLSKVAADKNKSKAERAEALLVASNLHWRYGARDKSLAAIDKALEIDRSASIVLQKARLLDAAGKAGAVNWYEKALRLVDKQTEGKIHLRLAIMKAGEKGAKQDDLKDLIRFAGKRDQDFQNRAAVTIALLGFQESALDLYKVTGKAGTASFRQYIRLGEWAIRAGKPKLAGKYALQALENAELKRDRLYGLAILVESHRMDDTLDDVIAYFEGEKDLMSEAYQVWVDLLREKGRYGEALALFQKNAMANSSRQTRQRLIRLYKEAGREEEMISEYRGLIKQEPDQVNWYAALSEYYLGLGESDEATKIWQAFLKANKDDGFILLKGAEPMSNMGYDALVTEKLEEHMSTHGTSAAMLFFLFELNKLRGGVAEAEEILSRLDKTLAVDAAERVDLAEAYERISKPKKALHIWEGLKKHGGGLGYEEKMRVARLYDGQGEKKQALSIWNDLWYEVKTPARRSFVESRMMTLAKETGELGNMVLDLEERLAGGTADAKASALLVRIYTQQQDKLSAFEIINEYFTRERGADGLIEQAKVYRLLGDYTGFEKINHKLIDVDPENKGEYLRSIILGLIDQGDKENIKKIFDILADLRAIDEDAVGGEFEAGVLVLAGLPDKGIDAYRRTMANDMSGDNYLLVSDLLKKQNRVDEAVTLLQYVVEETEDDEFFVVAIDGILNMFGADNYGQEAGQTARSTLFWVRRLILERLAQGTDKIYLYRLLGEVNHELQDNAGRFAALENTLSLSEGMRSSSLRQLVTMSQPANQIFGQMMAVKKSDTDRHLSYGRRLVALNEELPPEVYTDLGKVFLDQKDPVGAMKAFNMAIDTADRSDIVIETAVLFENADFEDQALDQYSKALVSNNSNLSVLLKIALLRELKGQNGLAHNFFAKALDILLLQQPISVKVKEEDFSPGRMFRGRKDETVTRSYERNYKALLQGYLASWPREARQVAANYKMLEDMLVKEISWVADSIDTKNPGKLAEHSRLDHMAQFVRRVAFATANYELADKLDGRIVDVFSDDERFIKSLIRERVNWGLYASARGLIGRADKEKRGELHALLSITPDGEDLISFDHALEKALKTRSFNRVKNISLLGGRQKEIMAVARGLLKMGFTSEVVVWGKAHLDAKNYRNLCEHIIGVIQRGQDLRKNIGLVPWGYLSTLLFQLEEVTGERVFSETALAKITKNDGQKDYRSLVGSMLPYIGQRGSPENLLDLIDKAFSGKMALSRGINIWVSFQKELVEPELAREMTELVTGYINKGTLEKNEIFSITNRLLQPYIHSANMGEAKKIYDVLLAKSGGTINVFGPAYLLKKGTVEEAVEAFLKVRWANRTKASNIFSMEGIYMQSLNALFLPEHDNVVKRQLDVMKAQLGQSEEFIKFQFSFDTNIYELNSGLSLVKDALKKFPKNEEYLRRLFVGYHQQENGIEAMSVLRRLLENDPKNMTYRAGLFGALLEFDRPAEALVLNEDSPENMLAPDFFTDLRTKQQEQRETVAILPFLALPSNTDNNKDIFRAKERKLEEALKAQDGEKARKSLRGLWQKVTEVQDGMRGRFPNIMGGGYENIVKSHFPQTVSVGLFGGVQPQEQGDSIFDAVVEYDFAPPEFEDYLRGLDVGNRDGLYEFYPYLIKAYQKHGMAEEKWQSLNKAVSEMKASEEDYTLWLTFLLDAAAVVSGDVIKNLDKNLVRYNNFSDYHLRSMARIYAGAGEMDRAVEAYRLLALKALVIRKDDNYGINFSRSMFTAIDFVDEAKQYLAPEQAKNFVEEIIRLVKPSLKGDGSQQITYERFIIRALGEVLLPEETLQQIGDVKEGTAEYLFDYASLLVKAQRQDEALIIIRKALFKEQKLQQNIMAAMGRGIAPMMVGMINKQSNDLYSRMIGFVHNPPTNTAFFPPGMKEFFPATGNPENIAWLSRAAVAMNGWGHEKKGLVYNLLFIANQMHEAGARAEITPVMADISKILFMDDISVEYIQLAIKVSEKIGRPLKLALAQKLLLERHLEAKFAVDVIERTLKAEGAAAALALAEKIAAHNHNDGVLAALVSIGEAMGDEKLSDHWRKIRAEEHKAREILKAHKIIKADKTV